MKHKVAQLKTEITINQIKAQREQRRKNKKQNNSLILHTPRPRAIGPCLFKMSWNDSSFLISCYQEDELLYGAQIDLLGSVFPQFYVSLPH